MAFDWAEYLSLAEESNGMLISGPPVSADARHRSGVSRAYYASYISARNRLRDIDHVTIPRSADSHRFTKDQYLNDNDPRRREIGIELDRLRVARNRCDYDDDVRALPTLTTRSITRAAKILADLSQL